MRERVAAGRKLADAIRATLPVRDPAGGRQRRPPATSAAAQVWRHPLVVSMKSYAIKCMSLIECPF